MKSNIVFSNEKSEKLIEVLKSKPISIEKIRERLEIELTNKVKEKYELEEIEIDQKLKEDILNAELLEVFFDTFFDIINQYPFPKSARQMNYIKRFYKPISELLASLDNEYIKTFSDKFDQINKSFLKLKGCVLLRSHIKSIKDIDFLLEYAKHFHIDINDPGLINKLVKQLKAVDLKEFEELQIQITETGNNRLIELFEEITTKVDRPEMIENHKTLINKLAVQLENLKSTISNHMPKVVDNDNNIDVLRQLLLEEKDYEKTVQYLNKSDERNIIPYNLVLKLIYDYSSAIMECDYPNLEYYSKIIHLVLSKGDFTSNKKTGLVIDACKVTLNSLESLDGLSAEMVDEIRNNLHDTITILDKKEKQLISDFVSSLKEKYNMNPTEDGVSYNWSSDLLSEYLTIQDYSRKNIISISNQGSFNIAFSHEMVGENMLLGIYVPSVVTNLKFGDFLERTAYNRGHEKKIVLPKKYKLSREDLKFSMFPQKIKTESRLKKQVRRTVLGYTFLVSPGGQVLSTDLKLCRINVNDTLTVRDALREYNNPNSDYYEIIIKLINTSFLISRNSKNLVNSNNSNSKYFHNDEPKYQIEDMLNFLSNFKEDSVNLEMISNEIPYPYPFELGEEALKYAPQIYSDLLYEEEFNEKVSLITKCSGYRPLLSNTNFLDILPSLRMYDSSTTNYAVMLRHFIQLLEVARMERLNNELLEIELKSKNFADEKDRLEFKRERQKRIRLEDENRIKNENEVLLLDLTTRLNHINSRIIQDTLYEYDLVSGLTNHRKMLEYK